MGIFELIGEHRNPGPVGQLEFQRPGGTGRAPIVRLLIAMTLTAGWTILLWRWSNGSVQAFVVTLVFTVAYLGIAYMARPEPDYSNIGWLGGLIDHPFRYSDDINRMLIFLLVVLWPGRVIATGFVDGLATLLGRYSSDRDPR